MKTPASRLRWWTDKNGRGFQGDDVIYLLPSVFPVTDAIVFRPSFLRFSVEGQKRFKYATCGRVF